MRWWSTGCRFVLRGRCQRHSPVIVTAQQLSVDLLHAWRQLRHRAWLSIAIVVTLAIGIGANTLLYSLVDALVFPPRPGIVEPDRVFEAYGSTDRNPEGTTTFSHETFQDLVLAASEVALLEGDSRLNTALTGDGSPERLQGLSVTQGYFALLGTVPAAGRLLGVDEPNDSVALSYEFWQRRFAGGPDVVGSRISLNRHEFTVVGVAESGFRGLDRISRADVFLPIEAHFRADRVDGPVIPGVERRLPHHRLVGRLRSEVSFAQAEAALSAHLSALWESLPFKDVGVKLFPIRDSAFGKGNREQMLRYPALLLAGVGLVLFIACFNLGSLFLGRFVDREREIAVRLSMGARRSDIARLLMAESAVLTVLGGLIGIALAVMGMPLLDKVTLPIAADLSPSLNLRVLVFACATALLVALLSGLAPALRFSALDPSSALGHRGTLGRRRQGRLRGALVVTQLAIALVILVAAVLFARTTTNLYSVPLGFVPEKVLVASVDLFPLELSPAESSGFFRELRSRLESVPGVLNVTMTMAGEPLGGMMAKFSLRLPDAGEDGEYFGARHALVGSGYFRTLGVPLLRGRDFLPGDDGNSSPVAIVNEAFSSNVWPGESALGKTLLTTLGSDEPFEVIGVVGNAKDRNLREEAPGFVYLYEAQHGKIPMVEKLMLERMSLLVRTTADPVTALPAVRAIVASMDPNLPLFNVGTLSERLVDAGGAERQAARLFGSFASFSLVLSVLAVYALAQSDFKRRVPEIGVRVALGARPADVFRLAVSRGLTLGLVGLVVGACLAVASSRLLDGYLFGVAAVDRLSYGAAALLLLSVVLCACALPAREAVRLDASEALRQE